MPVKRKKKQRGGRANNPPGGPLIYPDNNKWIDHKGTIAQLPTAVAAAPGPTGYLDRFKGFLKNGRYISRSLRAVGATSWADKAHQRGYGRSRALKF